EFGRATGGFVNAITKSGSNDIHASLLVNWEPDKLRSNAPNTYLADNDGDYSERWDVVAQLSGPIIKDHLFFYGLYNARHLNTFDGAVAGTGTRQKTASPFYGGKIDFVPIEGQRLEGTYFNTSGDTNVNTTRYNPTTNAIGAQTGYQKQLYGGENYVGRYTGNFTDWLTLSAAYGVNKNRSSVLPADIINARVIDTRTIAGGVPLPGTNPSSRFQTNDDKRVFYRADADISVRLAGQHHFRFGYDREDLTSSQVQTPIGGGVQTIGVVSSAASQTLIGQPVGTEFVGQRFFSVGGTFKSRNEAYYIQDNWQLFDERLTLQLGLRNDRFNVKNGLGQTFYESGNQWGPRLGASFDVFGDKKVKAFGSFGRYFIPIFSNTNIRAAGVQFDRTAYYRFNGFDSAGRPVLGAPITTVNGARACPDTGVANCRIISSGSSKDPTYITSRNLKSQFVDEYILGGEWQVADRWSVGVEATYRKLGRAIEDAAVDQAAIAYCKSKGFSDADCDSTYGGFSDYVLINPGSDQVITLYSDGAGAGLPDGTSPTVSFTAAQLGYTVPAKRDYYAVTFKFDRSFDGVWSLSGSYTWSQLKGNYEGGAKSDIGQADTGITQDFDQPGFVIGSYGFLPGHRRHTVKLYGSYAPLDWLNLGANLLVQSPKKFGCIGVVPTDVDPFANAYGAAGNFCGGKVVPRGSALQSDWRKELNLSVQFKLPTDAFDASLRFDVFNVFNTKSVLEREEFGEDDNGNASAQYGLPLGYQAPRSARVQFRMGF
ncbi:MAG: TonB-dependent receptor, partial [Novosphingobium sp.]